MDQTRRAGRLDINERLARFEGSSNRSAGIDLAAIRRGVLGPDTPVLSVEDYDLDGIARRSQGPGVPIDHAYRRFARVRNDEDTERVRALARYDRQMRQAQTVDRINAGGLATSTSAVQRFLESLPVLSPSNLTEDSQDCPICFERYEHRQHSEKAVNLPCNHVVGKDCLLKWLTSSALNLNNNTCPMCRTVLFERHHISFEDQLQGYHGVLDQVPGTHRPRVPNERPRVDGIVNQIRRDRDHISALLREMPPPTHEPVEVGDDFVPGHPEFDDMMQRHEERGRRLEQLSHTNSIQRQTLAPTREPADVRHGAGSELSDIVQRHEERGRRLEQLNHPNATLQETWARARQPARAPDGLISGRAVVGYTTERSQERETLLERLNRSEATLYELMARSREPARVRDGLGTGLAEIGDRIDGAHAPVRARNREYEERRFGGF